MSLFDVIRYPITNIFDQDEVDMLPKEITIPWLVECAERTGFTERNLSKLKGSEKAALWANVLMIRATDSPEEYDRYKEFFTFLLRQRIRDHE